MSGKRGTPEERFWRRVEKTETCWLWRGRCRDNGYGLIYLGGERSVYSVHRFSFEIHKGPIPAGLDVAHTCDVRNCVRPDHLFAATRLENMQDAVAKGRMPRKYTTTLCGFADCGRDRLTGKWCSGHAAQFRKRGIDRMALLQPKGWNLRAGKAVSA